MKIQGIDLRDTHQFSTFFLDYLEGKEELKPFYSHLPRLESFEGAMAQKTFSQDKRQILHTSLTEQYKGLELGDAVSANLESLLEKSAFTVTTGHQLNLFTGPLYFIYKIVSTINLAKKLKQTYPKSNFIPVYWMASEDHDFDEINYFKLDGKKFEWESDQTGAVGDFALDKSFQNFLKEVSFAAPVFLEAYRSSKTLAEAVRKYVHGLFGEHGLLIVDGNDTALKRIFSQVIKNDLLDHQAYKCATEVTEKLENLGYKGQIFPREINFFYMEHGCRERIELVGGRYHVLNTDISFSHEGILQKVEEHPESFSPNVVLRPLYQEMILPNIAYLGGPAEVIYWLQLKGVFDHFEVPFPIVLPRNFALILSEPALRKIDQLGWDVKEIFQDKADWKKDYVKKKAEVDLTLAQERLELSKLYDQAGFEAQKLEKSLQSAFEAGKVRSIKILDQMGRKLRKAEERRHKITFDRVDSLEAYLKPGGAPQERVVNMMQFYLSNPNLIEELLESLDPLDFKMWVLEV